MENGFWKMTLEILKDNKTYDVHTARGTIKGWRILSDAILFALANCKNNKNIIIINFFYTLKNFIKCNY